MAGIVAVKHPAGVTREENRAIKHPGPMPGPGAQYTRNSFAAKVFFSNDFHNKSFTGRVLTTIGMAATISECLKKSGLLSATLSVASLKNTQLFPTVTSAR